MSDYEIVRELYDDGGYNDDVRLLKVLNKETGTFVKSHPQDIIAHRFETDDKKKIDDGRDWWDSDDLAYKSNKVGMQLIYCGKECRAIVAYDLGMDDGKINEDMELEEILDSTPRVTVFDINGKQILQLERCKISEPNLVDFDVFYEENFSLRFGLDSISYTKVIDCDRTKHTRTESMCILDYSGRELFKKERTHNRKPSKQRADELMEELEMADKE